MALLTIRAAAAEDAALIATLLGELAAFENLPLTLTQDQLVRDFFGPDAVIACELAFDGDTPVGIVTWYWTYRSFAGARGLYLEDLFVRPAWRGKGHGKALLRHMAAKGAALQARRLEWLVLDWNAPAMEFYRRLGARPLAEWVSYRLDGEAMTRLAVS